MTFAANLRRHRHAVGLSIDAVARELSVARNTVYRWERGERVPRPKEQDQLAAVLGCKVADFYKEKDDE